MIGNPPYLKTEDIVNLEPAERTVYGRVYQTAYKQYDKYYLFVERAVRRLLKPGGRFCMIVSRKFSHIESGKKLRDLLSKHASVTDMLDFGSAQLFEGKLTYTCVLRFTLEDPTDQPLRYEAVADSKAWVRRQGAGGEPLDLPRSIVSGDRPWVLPSTDKELALLEAMLQVSIHLGDIMDVYNGIQTSRDAVYVIDKWEDRGNAIAFESDGQTWTVEKEVARPFFDGSGGGLTSFHPMPPVSRVVFPYRVDPGDAYRARLIPSGEMQTSFPGAWAWLVHNRDTLSARSMDDAAVWYQYGRTQAIGSFDDRPKLVVGVLSQGDKYVYDAGDVLLASGGTAGECAIAPSRTSPSGYDLHFVQAVLSSKAAEYFCRKRGSPFQGDGWFARGTAVLKDLPVPLIDFSQGGARKDAHDAIAAEARELEQLFGALPGQVGRAVTKTESDIRVIEARIERRVHKLYGVDGIVEDVNLPV